MAAMTHHCESKDGPHQSATLDPLSQPLLPLVGMVEFLFLTGAFPRVEEVVEELPRPIETPYAAYDDPQALLRPHLATLGLFEEPEAADEVVDEEERPLDQRSALSALVRQKILTDELEAINSALCAPCGCTLCCTGPGTDMQQEFFEIPLGRGEEDLFSVAREESGRSRSSHFGDSDGPTVEGRPFYEQSHPLLVHRRDGWGLILPRNTRCPQLDSRGRCRIYPERPEVCRRPQIFPYVLEKVSVPGRDRPRYRLRNCLLAVVDCPYVRAHKDAIAAYAAASELEMIFRRNKS